MLRYGRLRPDTDEPPQPLGLNQPCAPPSRKIGHVCVLICSGAAGCCPGFASSQVDEVRMFPLRSQSELKRKLAVFLPGQRDLGAVQRGPEGIDDGCASPADPPRAPGDHPPQAQNPPTRPNGLLEIDAPTFENYCAEVRKAKRSKRLLPAYANEFSRGCSRMQGDDEGTRG